MKAFKIYLLHGFLQNFTQTAFYIFGSLLLYVKTGSVLIVLIYGLIQSVVAVLIKSWLIEKYLKLVQRVGFIPTIGGSLLLNGISLIALFYLKIHGPLSLILLFSIGLVYSAGNASYWMLSNSLMFNYVGSSKSPGQYSAHYSTMTIISTGLAGFAGLFLNFQNNFLLLFILSGIMLVASIIPLHYITPPPIQVVSSRECIKKLSRGAFWANCNPDHQITTTAIPLIILFLFGSLSESIWINVTVALLTIICVYAVGKSKDRDNNRLLWFGAIALFLSFIFYGFIKTPTQFIILGVIFGIAGGIVGTAREARLGREVANTTKPIETTVAVEFVRSLGELIGSVILVGTFLLFGKLWQPILIIGCLAVLPKIIYALKNIDGMNTALQQAHKP